MMKSDHKTGFHFKGTCKISIKGYPISLEGCDYDLEEWSYAADGKGLQGYIKITKSAEGAIAGLVNTILSGSNPIALLQGEFPQYLLDEGQLQLHITGSQVLKEAHEIFTVISAHGYE